VKGWDGTGWEGWSEVLWGGPSGKRCVEDAWRRFEEAEEQDHTITVIPISSITECIYIYSGCDRKSYMIFSAPTEYASRLPPPGQRNH
jgi:hypothetical protein